MHGIYRQRSCDNLQNGKFMQRQYPTRSYNLDPLGESSDVNDIPKNFKFISPQSKFEIANSFSHFPQNYKHRSFNYNASTVVEYYRYDSIRHPLTPPPPPPPLPHLKISPNMDKELLLPTPVSTFSGENFFTSSEFDPILTSSSKQTDRVYHNETWKKQTTPFYLDKNFQYRVNTCDYSNALKTPSGPFRNHPNFLHDQNYQPLHCDYQNSIKRNSNICEYHFCRQELNSLRENNNNNTS